MAVGFSQRTALQRERYNYTSRSFEFSLGGAFATEQFLSKLCRPAVGQYETTGDVRRAWLRLAIVHDLGADSWYTILLLPMLSLQVQWLHQIG